jgi:predicted esterase
MNPTIHQDQPVISAGLEPGSEYPAVILLHGRGASAQSMVPLVEVLGTDQAAYLIPQAGKNRWYPNSAFSPLEGNQPDLDSALRTVGDLIQDLNDREIPAGQILLGGFSQGACLAAEYAVRNPLRYGGLFVLSGALIGPEGSPRNYSGSLEGTPVFLGSSDVDPWVKHALVAETARILSDLNGNVDFRTYPGMAHTINQDEIQAVRTLIKGVANHLPADR